MANEAIRVYKEISNLPSTLVKNSVYAVRTEEGFDLYVSDNSGNIAYKINNPFVNERLLISPINFYSNSNPQLIFNNNTLRNFIIKLEFLTTANNSNITIRKNTTDLFSKVLDSGITIVLENITLEPNTALYILTNQTVNLKLFGCSYY